MNYLVYSVLVSAALIGILGGWRSQGQGLRGQREPRGIETAINWLAVGLAAMIAYVIGSRRS